MDEEKIYENIESLSIDEQFRHLNINHNNIYQFVMLYYNYILAKHDYGTGDLVTMIESHTITYIEEHPNTTVSELSVFWDKSKGAISQTVSRLEERGFINKSYSADNAKSVLLNVTESGRKLSQVHKLYDTIDIAKTLDDLLQKCSIDEINSFFKVIKEYIVLLKRDFK
jgi:DNA-binding MarR family transcriptional regulator